MSNNLTAAAAVRLVMRYPFWCEVFYSMLVKEAVPGDGCDTLGTDGRSLWVNRDYFAKGSLDLQVAQLVHEIGHKIFLHCTRRGNREAELWNIACDYAVNSLMYLNGFVIPSEWLLDMRYAGWLAEAIYADLIKRRKENPQDEPKLKPGQADLRPMEGTPEEIAVEEDKVKTMVDRAMANAKAMGKLPKGIEQGTTLAYKPAREPWYNHLHRYMQSLAVAEYNWTRINRRTLKTHGVFAPLHYSEALGDITLFIDTSQSCFEAAQQANFAAHLNAILAEAKPKRVHLYYFDAKVYPGEVIEAGELDIATQPRGGGGTRFAPLFDQLEEDGINPEVCIVLTDLEGSFPDQEPGYPVVWANIFAEGEAPFGETIHLCD
jgi:predicted metal-dependent peptidase